MTTASSSSSTTLSPTHPLLLELSSIRAQLGQYQRTAHQASIALQGSRLELSLTQTENVRLSKVLETLRAEVETLRANPSPLPIPPQSTALTELSLAHRRLSAKLDLTEDALQSAQLELASTKQEVFKLTKEREGDKFALRELRLAQDEWEEGMAWEKGERQRLEEQKKLCDLALAEYATLVHSLDPSAVPPTSPKRSSTPNILLATPSLSEASPSSDTLTPSATPFSASEEKASPSENISNLLIGQKGVQRLLSDATSLLTSRETENRNLITRVSELEQTLSTLSESLSLETTQRISAQNERDAVLRDDAAAAKVVERYMTFTQKTHATIHLHLDNLRIRSGATQNTLRKEVIDLQKALEDEVGRGRRIKDAINELSEGLAREAAGRRREIALRLSMLANDEMRDRKVEKWLDRVRRTRKGPEGAILDATALEGLLDEGLVAVGKGNPIGEGGPKRWKVWGKRKEVSVPSSEGEEGLMRVLLAEELVHNLVTDLGIETDRRMDLEKQRVDWLAREALGGVANGNEDHQDEGGGVDKEGEHGGVVFEIGDDFDGPTPTPEPPTPIDPTTPAQLNVDDGTIPVPNTSPLIDQLREIFAPLEGRSEPLVKSLHDLSLSLSSIRASLPSPAPASPLSPIKGKKFLSLRKSPLEDPALASLLDAIHEVIEDARVDLQISRADEERVYRGFEALINVGKFGAVRENAVLADAREYVTDRMDSKVYEKLKGRIEDVEGDLASIKQKIHELSNGGEFLAPEEDESGSIGTGGKGVWESLDLRTVSTSTFNTRSPSPLSNLSNFVSSPLTPLSSLSFGLPLPSPNSDGSKQNPLAVVGNMGRSFSAGVISAPRKVGGLAIAGGLSFKRAVTAGKADVPGGGSRNEEKKLLDDDVE